VVQQEHIVGYIVRSLHHGAIAELEAHRVERSLRVVTIAARVLESPGEMLSHVDPQHLKHICQSGLIELISVDRIPLSVPFLTRLQLGLSTWETNVLYACLGLGALVDGFQATRFYMSMLDAAFGDSIHEYLHAPLTSRPPVVVAVPDVLSLDSDPLLCALRRTRTVYASWSVAPPRERYTDLSPDLVLSLATVLYCALDPLWIRYVSIREMSEADICVADLRTRAAFTTYDTC